VEQTFEIVIDHLVADEEFRHSFLRNPQRTLRADEWGLPLCDSEIDALLAINPSVWDHVAEQAYSRLQQAA
jgi:hypothetical protein